MNQTNYKKLKYDVIIVDDCESVSNALAYYLRKNNFFATIKRNQNDFENIFYENTCDNQIYEQNSTKQSSFHNLSNTNIIAIITDWHICKNYKGGDVILFIKNISQNLPIIIYTTDNNVDITYIQHYINKNMQNNKNYANININYSNITVIYKERTTSNQQILNFLLKIVNEE